MRRWYHSFGSFSTLGIKQTSPSSLQQYADESKGDTAAKVQALLTIIGSGKSVIATKIAATKIDLMENLNRAIQNDDVWYLGSEIKLQLPQKPLDVLGTFTQVVSLR